MGGVAVRAPRDEQDFGNVHISPSADSHSTGPRSKFYEGAQTLLEVGEFDYSALIAFRAGELVDAFHDGNVPADSLERFSRSTKFWKFGVQILDLLKIP